MEAKLKKGVLKHLGVYKVMTDIALKDRSINFAQRKVLKGVLKELDLIINQLND